MLGKVPLTETHGVCSRVVLTGAITSWACCAGWRCVFPGIFLSFSWRTSFTLSSWGWATRRTCGWRSRSCCRWCYWRSWCCWTSWRWRRILRDKSISSLIDTVIIIIIGWQPKTFIIVFSIKIDVIIHHLIRSSNFFWRTICRIVWEDITPTTRIVTLTLRRNCISKQL